MASEGSAREVVLGRIRAAVGGISSAEVVGAGGDGGRRRYRRSARRERGAVIELFEDRLRDYDAQVVRVGRGDVASAAAKMLAGRGVKRLVVPAGLRGGLMV